MHSRKFPFILLILVAFIAIINGLAVMNSWYWTIRWLDMPMHFLGGAWIAGVFLWWKYFYKGKIANSFMFIVFSAIFSAFLVGFLWEAYEAVVGIITKGVMNDLGDTLSDLMFDMIGAIVVAVLVRSHVQLKS